LVKGSKTQAERSGAAFYMWTLYRVNCLTPKHIYIGISQKPFKRILDHKKKSGAVFTKNNGVKSFSIIREFESHEEAKLAERNEVIRLNSLRKINGSIVCGGGWSGAKGISW
jgi:predicted GIY-YIG superfamily endonuclease